MKILPCLKLILCTITSEIYHGESKCLKQRHFVLDFCLRPVISRLQHHRLHCAIEAKCVIFYASTKSLVITQRIGRSFGSVPKRKASISATDRNNPVCSKELIHAL
ncbi:hypothetical protein L596_021955 [Steinernema carpocapsae]|uniref:Uncharacterized protein n=1 Tax=Steinernema carpocapsae TaxID=34508 RepID=A0A4U5MKA1_STECR|nr:hypothetical protein L596_021955 [Steinernema carpocapsae]